MAGIRPIADQHGPPSERRQWPSCARRLSGRYLSEAALQMAGQGTAIQVAGPLRHLSDTLCVQLGRCRRWDSLPCATAEERLVDVAEKQLGVPKVRKFFGCCPEEVLWKHASPLGQSSGSTSPAAFVRAVRIALKLTRQEAAAVLGGRRNAFHRYERAEVLPPWALVYLLSLLVRHSDLLSEIRSYP